MVVDLITRNKRGRKKNKKKMVEESGEEGIFEDFLLLTSFNEYLLIYFLLSAILFEIKTDLEKFYGFTREARWWL